MTPEEAAARALAKQQASKTSPPPPLEHVIDPDWPEPLVAFAVVHNPDGYQTIKIELLEDGTVDRVIPLREPIRYEALAYQYLVGDIESHWAQKQVKRAQRRPTKPAPAAAPPVEGAKP